MKKLLFILIGLVVAGIASCVTPGGSTNQTINEVKFNNIPETMIVGEEVILDFTKQEGVSFEFESSNEKVLSVKEETITAVAEGEAKLTATFTLGTAEKEYSFDITVVAPEEEKYNIYYDLNGGSMAAGLYISEYTPDMLPLTLATDRSVSKVGYTFVGWWTNPEFTGEKITVIEEGSTGDITIYAKWEEDKPAEEVRTINYQLDGGELPEGAPTEFVVGVGVELPIPSKEGYEFVGWTKTKYGSTYITKVSDTQKTNITVFAQWEKLKVYGNIEYVLEEGTLPENAPVKYEEGTSVTLPIPTKKGYRFLGWSLEEGTASYVVEISATQTGDVVLYANWEEYYEPVVGDPFSITYELNGGSWEWTVATVADPAKCIDAVSNLPEVFMADFYTYLFENGLLNSSKVSTKIQVNNWVDFSKNNGDPVALYNTTSTVRTGAADGYSELFWDSVNGYEAVGGFLGTSPYKEKYANVTKHIIQMTLLKYSTVPTTDKTFKAGAGFVLDGYFYGTQGLLASSKTGYETFNALRGLIPTPTVGYEGNVTSTNEYVVSNGVVGTPVKLVAPVKEGHMFLGWYTNPEFNGEKVTEAGSTCSLYARWYDLNAPAPTYKITYVLNGGVNNVNAPVEFVFGSAVELLKPSKEGYTFIGWSTDAEGLNIIKEISAVVNNNITVYANWIEGAENVYKITYNYTDGKLPTYKASSLEEFAEVFWKEFHAWYGSNLSIEDFKTAALSSWKSGADGGYKVYKQNAQGQVDEAYFANAKANIATWGAWVDVFDSMVSSINGEQTAWGSTYVGYLRMYAFFMQSASYWTAERTKTCYEGYPIPYELATEYKLGDEFDLLQLTIDDGRTFLGWYDDEGNKVEKITPSTEGDLVLTAKWSEAIAVESFEITNPVNELLKLSKLQLNWVIGPSNATFKKVTFASTDTNVLTVDENGLVEALNIGTAKILITVHGNTDLNMELEIEVYVDPYIDGTFEDESYVVAGESIQLGATIHEGPQDQLVWTSKTPDIALAEEGGVVVGVKEGLAEIVVSCANNPSVSFTFYVTVLNEEPTGMLKLLLDSNNKEIYTRDHLLIGIKIGSDGAYYSDIVGSVSKLLFTDYEVHDDYYLANPNNKSTLNGDGIGGIDFITVHYAADMPYSASAMFNGGRNLASYNQSCNNGASQASWHYSVGNDGIWACQTESYGAWHAGASKKMTWTDSGVTTDQVGTDVYTTDVKMGSDGYFYIKGFKTNIKNESAGTKLNGMGLGVKVVGKAIYLGGHYQNTTYNYISSTGGNNNSIGMETSVREGSDLWLTWQYTAQLCAKLLLKYKLPLNRLVGHHFFSGKWCPQPMLEYDLEIWYEFVELTRQQMSLYENYSNYSLSFESSSDYLGNNGRVTSLPAYPECATYTVTYSDGNTSKTITLSSILPGNLE